MDETQPADIAGREHDRADDTVAAVLRLVDRVGAGLEQRRIQAVTESRAIGRRGQRHHVHRHAEHLPAFGTPKALLAASIAGSSAGRIRISERPVLTHEPSAP